ncbi:MAG: hypothetical protein DRQ51_10395 [Gammaproteobacteria bacterium]|nr:MAG: hypothetical protein DRQ51_10395 [Gammaproteobacteria bacterium]
MTIQTNKLHPQYLKNSTGTPSFVVLPVLEYEELIEDYNDLTVMNERENEDRISLSDFKKIIANY